jgi:HEAT repeat protein
MRSVWLVVLAVSAAPAAAQVPQTDQWIRDLGSPSMDARHAAATSLMNCAVACRAAVPALVTMLEKGEPEDRMDAAFALHEIVSGLQEAARVAHKPVAGASAADCGAILPVLRPLLAGGEPARGMRLQLAQVAEVTLLGACASTADVSTLVALLQAPGADVTVRSTAAEALGAMGPAAAAAIPALTPLMTDENSAVRDAATAALAAIKKSAAPSRR